MTRKRLKKLLMAYGIQRNEAERVCWAVQQSGIPYAKWWREHGAFYRSTYYIRKGVDAFRKSLAEAAVKITHVLGDFAQSVAETMRKNGL